MSCMKPDIAYTVSKLNKCASIPIDEHLKGTIFKFTHSYGQIFCNSRYKLDTWYGKYLKSASGNEIRLTDIIVSDFLRWRGQNLCQ